MSPSSLIDKVAPAFSLKNHDGTNYEFKPESGTPTAIFFYPKSGTYLPRTIDHCKKLTALQALLDALGRHASSEMRSSVDDHSLPPFSSGRSSSDFTENDAFKGSNLRVIGISPDSVEEQDTFVKKQKLTVSSPNMQCPAVCSDSDSQYPVLSDSAGEFRQLYGVGKGIMGLVDARVTYFVDSKGVVR